jgi:Helix-hairpin-helix domain
MPRRDRPRSGHTKKPGDDLEKIAGIGPALAQRLQKAGIRTYQDLAERTPDEIAEVLKDVSGVSPQRVTNQDWTGQARQLLGAPVGTSDPSQRYASFHVELLLDADDKVRRTKVHHHQSDTVATWPGWDQERLLSLLRDRVPLTDVPQLAPTGDIQATPSFFVRIEDLAPIRHGKSAYERSADEPTSVRLSMRVDPTDEPHVTSFDFTAEISARALGGRQLWSVGTKEGKIRINEPASMELTGPSLPSGLYRLVVNVALYRANHGPEEQPLSSRGAAGGLMQVTDHTLSESAPAGVPTPSKG